MQQSTFQRPGYRETEVWQVVVDGCWQPVFHSIHLHLISIQNTSML